MPKSGTDRGKIQNSEFYLQFWLKLRKEMTNKDGKKFINVSIRVLAVNILNRLLIVSGYKKLLM